MCTLTAVSAEISERKIIRIAFNRDEKRKRAQALAPILEKKKTNSFCYPVDVQAGGTWVAANSAGLVFALLNVNLPPSSNDLYFQKKSRGVIIPSLLSSASLEEVSSRMQSLPVAEFSPFRLFATSLTQWSEWVFKGDMLLTHNGNYEAEPRVFRTSSSYGRGDESVELPRLMLWRQANETHSNILNCQEYFHRHQWPAAKHLSVFMEREDALTVSHTVVDLTSAAATMRYFPNAPEFLEHGFAAVHESTSLLLEKAECRPF